MKVRLIAQFAAAFAACIFAAPSADAVVSTTFYAGSACQQVSGGSPGYWRGTISNLSTTSDMVVACPAMVSNASTVHAVPGGHAYVYARHPTIPVSCTLFNVQMFGSSVSEGSASSSAVNRGASIADLGFISSTLDDVNGHVYLECTIPRMSSGNASHIADYVVLLD